MPKATISPEGFSHWTLYALLALGIIILFGVLVVGPLELLFGK